MICKAWLHIYQQTMFASIIFLYILRRALSLEHNITVYSSNISYHTQPSGWLFMRSAEAEQAAQYTVTIPEDFALCNIPGHCHNQVTARSGHLSGERSLLV